MYAIIDIETTGGNAYTDKITEIAIYIHDGRNVIEEYETLVNPGRSIPDYVQKLTGITNMMVADAPVFSSVAKEILRLTENYIFVAHNSNFDYSFITQEFRNIGQAFSRPTICTVSFSRKVLPGHRSYSLSSLCERLNIINISRHRAAGDAFATTKLFEMLLNNGGKELIPELIKYHETEISLPDCIRPEVMQTLSVKPGIYYFLNKNNKIIYIGKGLNIRKAVLNTITNSTNKKSMRLRQELSEIRFEETGNYTLASILELYELKKHKPDFNKKHDKIAFPRQKQNMINGFLVLKGRKVDEEVFIRLEHGNVTGFSYVHKESQVPVSDLMITIPVHQYTNYIVHRAIIHRQYLRVIPI